MFIQERVIFSAYLQRDFCACFCNIIVPLRLGRGVKCFVGDFH